MPEVEAARVPSPDAKVDLVMTESNPGATGSYLYRIRLLPHGGDATQGEVAAELYGATRNGSAYGADLRWQDAQTAVVDYLQAKSVSSPQGQVHVAGRAITLVLNAGIENAAAAPGGMVKN